MEVNERVGKKKQLMTLLRIREGQQRNKVFTNALNKVFP